MSAFLDFVKVPIMWSPTMSVPGNARLATIATSSAFCNSRSHLYTCDSGDERGVRRTCTGSLNGQRLI